MRADKRKTITETLGRLTISLTSVERLISETLYLLGVYPDPRRWFERKGFQSKLRETGLELLDDTSNPIASRALGVQMESVGFVHRQRNRIVQSLVLFAPEDLNAIEQAANETTLSDLERLNTQVLEIRKEIAGIYSKLHEERSIDSRRTASEGSLSKVS